MSETTEWFYGTAQANAVKIPLNLKETLENSNGLSITAKKKRVKANLMVEKTFVMLKPETVSRNLSGEIVKRIENAGFRIVAMKLTRASLQQAQKLYEPHIGKSFYNELIQHIISGPILPMIVEKADAIKRMRTLIGATNPAQAETGTIRKDFGISLTKNAIHAADSPQNAEREAKIFFNVNEIIE